MRAEEGFQFERFRVGNPWTQDVALRLTILRLMSSGGLEGGEIGRLFQTLGQMGDKIAGEYTDIAATLDNPTQEPTLVQYDAWGKRIDKLVTGEGWRRLKAVAALEGIVAESYPSPHATRGGGRDRLGKFARLFAFTRIVMFGPISKVVLCPVSMSDGAVRVLEMYGTAEQKKLIKRLCSINEAENWTAGQWMTERPGGSDVSRTETVARPVDTNKTPKAGDKFVIDGFKWFSSATDGDVALALARTDTDLKKGSKGLSLFLIKIRDDTGALNGIRVHRLKKKLGTKYLPTAELELNGSIGELIGEIGRGVATISSVLNITRLYSAAGAVGGLSWGLRSATAYAQIRLALGGGKLSQLPLHTDQLLKVTVLYRAYLQIFFNNVLLIGAVESNQATEREKRRLRLLTPALKAFVATRGSDAYLTLLESFGGQGYMEEVGMGEMLRDLSVERIWEGTPAILSLDVLRVLVTSGGKALEEFLEDASGIIKALPAAIKGRVGGQVEHLSTVIGNVAILLSQLDMARHTSNMDLRFARHLLDIIMSINASLLLLQHAGWLSSHLPGDVVRLAGGDLSQHAEESIHVARLWISSHGDLDRLVSQLYDSIKSENAAKDVQLAHSLVYTWQDSKL